MKRWSLLLLLVAILPASVAAGAARVAAAPPAAVATAAVAPTDGVEYLIGLPLPREWPVAAPGAAGALSLTWHATAERAAAPLLAELGRLQGQGRILSYRLDPAQFAVRVIVAGELPALLADHTYAVAGAAGPPACAAGLPQALAEMARWPVVDEAAPRAPADGPTIIAHVRAPYVGQVSAIRGRVEANAAVAVRIYRNGSLYAESQTESGPTGHYSLVPEWQACPHGGVAWFLQPGDIVEVTSGGETARTTVVPLVAAIDHAAGVVEGWTAPNRAIRGELYMLFDGFCANLFEGYDATSDASGHFSAPVGQLFDIDGRSSGSIFVTDQNGQATSAFVESYRIITTPADDSVVANVHRNAAGTVTLRRGGQVIAQTGFVADAVGQLRVTFPAVGLLSGDSITVADGFMSLVTTVDPVDLRLDAANDSLVGTTAPGRVLSSTIFARDEAGGMVVTGCQDMIACGGAIATAQGAVNIAAGFDVRPGDYAHVVVYDDAGNSQVVPSVSAPALVAGPGSGQVRGYWATPQTALTVRLYDIANQLKAQAATTTGPQGEFSVLLSQTAVAGDRVEVSDGSRTRSMTVAIMTGRLGIGPGGLSLVTPTGPLVVAYFDDSAFSTGFVCAAGEMVGGDHTLDLSAWISPGDTATVYRLGIDGGYTMLALATFDVTVYQGSSTLSVRTTRPNAQVRLHHLRGGGTIYDHTATSTSSGFLTFSSAGLFLAGDTVEVTGLGVEAPSHASIVLTPLTAVGDPARHAVQGLLPPQTDGLVHLTRRVPRHSASLSRPVTSDAKGRYEVFFDPGLTWGGYPRQSCRSVLIRERCTVAAVEYRTAAGHSVILTVPDPPPVSADNAEPDNSPATAKPHAGGTQLHSFHVATDVDWVQLDVPAWAVGRPVVLRARNLGWGVEVGLALYRADGVTPAPGQSHHESDAEVMIVWRPDAAGSYRLRVAPEGTYAAAHCDAVYDLRVDWTQVGLPLVMGR